MMQESQGPIIVKQEQTPEKLYLEVELQPDSDLEIQCNFLDQDGKIQSKKILKARGVHKPLLRLGSAPVKVAFLLALILYLVVRLVGIEDFPIYFFSDEAIQSVHAADLIRDQMVSPYGDFLPTFFMNGEQYNLSTSVYFQVLPVLLFGKQVWVTRGAAALLSLLAAVGVGLMIEKAFNRRWGWMAVLVLSLMPAWFLHSRTAFETAMAVSFYAVFVCCYALYRIKDPRYLYGAATFAALAFYSYNPMRLVVCLTLTGFFLSDLRFHWQHKLTFLKAIGLGLIFLLPFFRFWLDHPGESIRHLEILGSYWVQNIPIGEKIGNFAREYLHGLNPLYWYLPNQLDFERHLMKDNGHLWQPGFPFLLIGIAWCILNVRQSQARMLLILLLAAPSGAALVALGITRSLVMVIPITLLTIIGIMVVWDWLVERISSRRALPRHFSIWVGIGVFVVMVVFNINMLVDALRNGSTWFSNYGLYGMQYGAQQVFGSIEEELSIDPEKKFYLTSTWANGADVLARFFFDDPLPFEMGSIDGFINEYKPLDPEMVFVMLPNEMENMLASQKFTDIRMQKVLNYPNGEPGFYFVKVAYVENIEDLFAAEQAARRFLNNGEVMLIDGEVVAVEYSTLDMGEIQHIFDGDKTTLARTWEANPLRMIVRFSNPRLVEKILLRVGGEATLVEVEGWGSEQEEPFSLSMQVEEASDPRFIELVLSQSMKIEWVDVRVKNLNNEEPAHVHLWELQFYP
ncbi:MAG: glycosyltransferase family 39 protein [Anaerolineaceae bacterium]|nr:glycosyltransferase family 39 protein [Anaerolineaceae bacterium]